MNAEQPTILDLPTEILEIIFSHLKFKDRMSASLVCRRWSGPAIPYSKVQLKLGNCWNTSIYDEFLTSDRPYRHLELHNIVHKVRYTTKMISKFRDSLETLEVEDVYEWNWMKELCGLPRLRHLCMKCPLVIKSPILRSSRPCGSMRSLAIEEIDSYDFAFLNTFISETFPGLTTLRLREFIGDLYISGLPNLEILEFSGTSVLDDRLLKALKALPKLRYIKLTGRMFECNYSAESLNIDQIERVEINTSVRIDDEQLLQLTKVFPAMNCFIIGNYFTNCTATGVQAAKKRLPNCTFRMAPVDRVMEYGSDFESTDLDTDSESSGKFVEL